MGNDDKHERSGQVSSVPEPRRREQEDEYDGYLRNLANEILRLTSEQQEQEDPSKEVISDAQSKATSAAAKDGVKKDSRTSLPSSGGGYNDCGDGKKKLVANTRSNQKLVMDDQIFVEVVMNRVAVLKREKNKKEKEVVVGVGDQPNNKDNNSSIAAAGAAPQLVLPTTRLQRGSAAPIRTSEPGAYAVAPLSNNNNVGQPQQATHSTTNTTSTQNSESNQEEAGGTPAALEAVRVEDISVKGEHVQDDSGSSKKKFMIPGVLIVLIVVLATSLTTTTTTEDPVEETLPPTYHPDTRMELLRDLILEEFGPIYELNYNNKTTTTSNAAAGATPIINGTELLTRSLYDPETPQYQALEWLATEDNEVAGIREPMLEPGFVDDRGSKAAAVATGGGNDSSFDPANSNNRALRYQPSLGSGGTTLNDHHRQLIGLDRIIQRYSLAVLIYSTTSNTSSWTDSFEFLANGTECDWSGAILCDTNSNAVIHLDLPGNNLVGTIPLELAALTSLESLNLGSNKLSGTIPEALSKLSQLKVVDLGLNDLTGTIPTSLFKNWKDIEVWTMSRNSFSGSVPPEISGLSNLKSVWWFENKLEGTLPNDLWTNLVNLTEIELSGEHGLTFDFVTDIGLLTDLRYIGFRKMSLRGEIPTQIGLLTNLEYIHLSENRLTGPLPSQIGLLTKLDFMHLGYNGITGTLPHEWTNFGMLKEFQIANTLLSGDVAFFCDAIDNGTMKPMKLRMDMREVSGCRCCACCKY